MSIAVKREENAIVEVSDDDLKVLEWGLTRRKEIADQMEKLMADKEAIDEILLEVFRRTEVKSAAANDYGTIVFKAGSKGRATLDKKKLQEYLVSKKVSVKIVTDAFKVATKIGKPGAPGVSYYKPGKEEEGKDD